MKIKKLLIASILCLAMIVCFSKIEKTITIAKAAVPAGYTLDTTYDIISLSDLSFKGLSNQEIIRDNENTELTFTKTDEDGSLIFKFKYDVIDPSTLDSNAMRIHFDVADNKWNSDCSVWFRGDGTYLACQKDDLSFGWEKNNALTLGMHEIEFGRIALFQNGVRTDKYYVYYKVDGTEIRSLVNQYDVSKMDGNMFINFDTQINKVYDISHIAGPYEIPDRITISDLKKNGGSIGKSLLLDKHQTYSYDSTADHKSVVLSFLYEVKDRSTVDCQIHFKNGWLGDSHGGIIWFKSENNLISKVGGGYVRANPFPSNGIYKVELSKLYITSGDDAGKYYISMAIDGSVVLEYVIADMPDSDSIFFTGKNGDYMYDTDYMPIDLDTDLYLYKWDVSKSGVEFVAQLRKDLVDFQNVSEIGFILASEDDPNDTIKLVGKLIESGSYYLVKAAIASINAEDITKRYVAKAYYVIPNKVGANKTYYSKNISSSFYEELDDLSSLSEENRTILNGIKAGVLNITVDDDTYETVGATKSGDYTSSTVVFTGPNESYNSFVLNGNFLKNGDLIMIGYIYYKVSLGSNTITLTKQTKKMIYGGSEHFVELNKGHDTEMTAVNLSPMASELGLKSIRLDISFNDLFILSSNNELTVNTSHVSKVQGVLDELKANGGIVDFLGVFHTILPYGYKTWDDEPWGEKTAPNPSTEPEYYQLWLSINGEAARITAELFPDIRNFETWNEPEMMGEQHGPLANPNGTNYSVTEKAKILTDLSYYFNAGIKAANSKNILTSPSICCSQTTDNDFDVPTVQFLTAIYQAIADSTPVTGYQELDTDPNNYFQVINIHPYTERGTTIYNWKTFMNSIHAVAENYGDRGTPVWITEFGYPYNRESNYLYKMSTILAYADQLDYLTKFYFYKIHDYTDKIGEDRWGLYDYEGNIKDVGTLVKNYIEEHQ